MRRAALAAAVALLSCRAVLAQGIDMSHGGQIEITSSQGMEWRQEQQEVIARGDARAVRGDTTVTADQLIAFYRKKGSAPGTSPSTQAASKITPASGVDTGDNEIYRLEAIGLLRGLLPGRRRRNRRCGPDGCGGARGRSLLFGSHASPPSTFSSPPEGARAVLARGRGRALNTRGSVDTRARKRNTGPAPGHRLFVRRESTSALV